MTETTDTQKLKSPWHLWLVGVLSLVWNGFGCVDFAMTATQNAAYLSSYPEEMLAYWLSMPWYIWALWAIGVFGGLAGSIALLMRRKMAVWLFGASFLAAFISNLFGALDKNAPRMEGAAMFGMIIILIALGLVLYAGWMSRRGILR